MYNSTLQTEKLRLFPPYNRRNHRKDMIFMAKKAFKAESKRLLDMMINSIYTHKEIFLRELISNASDALDKLYFKSLTENLGIERKDLGIDLAVDKDNRLITITDNGIGMTKDELENNLGVIANSGSFKFKNDNTDTDKDDINVIGQFGVGFYSAFMVASEVTVESKAYGSEQAYKWYSQGVDGYTITECDKEDVGTKITLKIKENTEEEEYDEYLQDYKLRMIVKKYSDYIRYPIRMEVSHQHLKEGTENEYETHTEIETLNSMVPIWNKSKSELKDEDYNQFYKEKFFDYDDPIAHIHTKAEGTATYNALMYIPSKAPFDYYSKDYEKGLQLYSNGVLIMDKCPDLLPDYFSFVKGLVDSADLSLNISREMLQHDRQLKIIEKSLERSIKNELTKMLRNDRERYEKFWKVFGLQIKFGVYNGFGAGKELLKDLLLFYSSYEKKLVTLEEYVSKRTELLAEELKMPNVSITLFEPVKTTGELKSVFRFAYKGRNYAALSLSERTAAGLEICALMRRLTGLNFPVFIDNTESVANFDMSALPRQTVFLRMVKNAPLSVRSMSRTPVAEELPQAS